MPFRRTGGIYQNPVKGIPFITAPQSCIFTGNCNPVSNMGRKMFIQDPAQPGFPFTGFFVCNHFEISEQVELYFLDNRRKNQNAKLTKLESFSGFKNGRHFALLLKGFTEKNCIPAFMNDNDYYQVVERIFNYWDNTLSELSKYQQENNIRYPIDPLTIFSPNGGIVDTNGEFTELFSYLYPIYFKN